MRSDIGNWLQGLLGKKLKEVFALTYVFNGQYDFVNPQALDIRFESACNGILKAAQNGEHIIWQKGHTLKYRDLGDYGVESVEQVSHLEVWASAIGRALEEFNLISSLSRDAAIGIALGFDSGVWVFVLNYGDELCVFNEIPNEILDSENLVFL